MAHNREGQKQYTANVPLPSKLNVTDGSNLAQGWKRFRRNFENYAIATRLTKEEDEFQCAVFLATIGEEAVDIFEGLHFEDEAERKNLKSVIQAFEDFCIGKTHEAYESYKFHLRKQRQDETIEAYIAQLRQLAKPCNFGDAQLQDRLIRDQVVVGVREESLREKFLEDKNLTLSRCLDIGRAYESSRTQSHSMSQNEVIEVNRLQRGKSYKQGRSQGQGPGSKGKFQRKEIGQHPSGTKCQKCGRGPHDKQNCPAKDAECFTCKKMGHFSTVCRNKKSVRQVDQDKFFLGSLELEDENGVRTVQGKDLWRATITTIGKPVEYRIDTGADVTVIPDRYFRKNSPLVKRTDKKLFGVGQNELKVKGVVQATLETKNTSSVQDLYVVTNLKEPLLGRPAIEALQLYDRINEVRQETSTGIPLKYPELFKGLGKIDKPYKITLDEEAKPFSVAAPRRLPLPMKEKVKEELERLQEQEVIVPVSEPTDWCAPIVVIPKSNGKIRLCVDFTRLNESVQRENFPLPTTDQLLAQLSGCEYFSKLDCNSGFFQIPLDEKSQKLTTFITPFGRFCFKRLPFGISSGPEVFQREMSQIVSGIPGVVCDIDDILISGKTQEEHDKRLDMVLQRMKEAGVTLNEKCVFSVKSIKFLGHIISKDGIHIDPEKVEAISKFPRPEKVSDVRSLLGMMNHIGKFAPGLAETTKPLRDLLKNDIVWTWDEPQEQAFQKLKAQMSTAPVLIHYSPQKPTKISADASSYGMGGVLMQKEDSHWKPVYYISRSLTDTEQRYAQVEKEALAVTWCCERFADFLVGLPKFLIETDHKPLLALMKTKHLDELTPRIQRFRMRMMRFSYNIVHVPGKNLVTADALSRAPVGKPGKEDHEMEEECEMHVRSILEGFPTSDKKLKEIREQQDADEICRTIKEYCRSSWPAAAKVDHVMKPYYASRDELTVEQGLLLYQCRLVIPTALRQDILKRLHEGHQGIVKCRALARSSVWWPGLSQQIETLVMNCPDCEKERRVNPEPLKPTDTPNYPWQRVGMDLFVWKGHTYLLVVDYYSRWIEIAHLREPTATVVVEHCKSIFARYGIPEAVVSDNGFQFTSYDFKRFSNYYGFTHLRSSPLHPQSNGEAERAVKTVKMLLSKSEDAYLALLNYRSTPLQQGQSPSQLLMGRTLRTRIPILPRKLLTKGGEEFRKKDSACKEKQKRNFDLKHRVKPMEELSKGQPVWVKTPKDAEATVVEKAGDRSYLLKTKNGLKVRNRHQIRIRTEGHDLRPRIPSEGSTLPRPQPELPVSQDSDTCLPAPTRYKTRSGRQVRPPERLDL